MKKLLVTLTLMFVCLLQVFAGSLTISTTAPQDARIATAVGSILGLGRDATGAEVKAFVIQYIRQSVQDYERRQNQTSFVPTALDPN